MANLLRLIKTYDDFRGDEAKTGKKSDDDRRRRRDAFPAPTEQTTEQPSEQPEAAPEVAAEAPFMPVAPARAPEQPATSPGHAPGASPAPPVPAEPITAPVTPPQTAAPDFPAPASPATAPPAAPTAAARSALDPRSMAVAGDLYERALIAVSRMFEAAVMENIAPGRLLAAVRELEALSPEVVQSLSGDRGLIRKAMGTYAEGEGFVLPHSVNVAVLAVELGGELGLAQQNLLDLCLAGFVHDIGSVHLPQGLLTKSESLTPSEWDEMRTRPQHTYEALTGLDERYARVAEIAYQVYERLDGSGYPRGLQGDEILPEARVLGTVDFFESFAHPRPYKTALPGTANHGIQMLMQMADKFGSATLKALVGSIGLFPIGSYVRLSSGEIGRVVDVKRENPMRPEVEILLDSEHRPPELARTLDLLSIPHIYVSRALTASDLRELGMLPSPSKMPPWSADSGPS